MVLRVWGRAGETLGEARRVKGHGRGGEEIHWGRACEPARQFKSVDGSGEGDSPDGGRGWEGGQKTVVEGGTRREEGGRGSEERKGDVGEGRVGGKEKRVRGRGEGGGG